MSLTSLTSNHHKWMNAAILQARKAFDQQEIPVGAVVVKDGVIVGKGHNMIERLSDPTAHAEMLALTAAADTLGQKYLHNATLYVTLEPCPMCAGAIVLARVQRLVFGTFDNKSGAASTLYNIPQDPRLNHHVDIISGVQEETCSDLLKSFFSTKR